MHVINTIEKHLHLRSIKLDILPSYASLPPLALDLAIAYSYMCSM